ncbi:hypothetical protein [Nocardiopsis tropica]|jgi:hypothetical protein|uniref:Uncharacterized protein n=1 Tax=Nocardiopsis tropica TaxID=109330 RepID=A0ABU7KYF2_9ACTN|nr:hypothetical protein [Nocardiopsis umidischolae]MEE2054340.1 hypothetical protein [Nocardiopsis umidischolae]
MSRVLATLALSAALVGAAIAPAAAAVDDHTGMGVVTDVIPAVLFGGKTSQA